jgi:UDP-glucose 4-epimerase
MSTVNNLQLISHWKHDCRLIFASNSGIYDTSALQHSGESISEQTPDNPKTPYDLDKLSSERYLKMYQNLCFERQRAWRFSYVIFRFATVYGDRQRTSDEWKPVIAEFIDKVGKGQRPTIYWDGDQTRDFVMVDDIVDALMLAKNPSVEVRDGKPIILGTGRETSINDVFGTVCGIFDRDIIPEHMPANVGDIARMKYDCTRAYKILGWRANTSLENGIKTMIERNTLWKERLNKKEEEVKRR